MKMPTIVLLAVSALASTAAEARRARLTLDGEWTIVAIDGKRTTGFRGSAPFIRFRKDRVSGTAGCNGFSGTFVRQGLILKFGEVIATEMGCAEPLNTQEASFFAVLGPSVTIRALPGGGYALSEGAHSAVLRRRPETKGPTGYPMR
jgi:heat shock protein HslJ